MLPLKEPHMRRRTLTFSVCALALIAYSSFPGGAADRKEDWPAYSGDKGAT